MNKLQYIIFSFLLLTLSVDAFAMNNSQPVPLREEGASDVSPNTSPKKKKRPSSRKRKKKNQQKTQGESSAKGQTRRKSDSNLSQIAGDSLDEEGYGSANSDDDVAVSFVPNAKWLPNPGAVTVVPEKEVDEDDVAKDLDASDNVDKVAQILTRFAASASESNELESKEATVSDDEETPTVEIKDGDSTSDEEDGAEDSELEDSFGKDGDDVTAGKEAQEEMGSHNDNTAEPKDESFDGGVADEINSLGSGDLLPDSGASNESKSLELEEKVEKSEPLVAAEPDAASESGKNDWSSGLDSWSGLGSSVEGNEFNNASEEKDAFKKLSGSVFKKIVLEDQDSTDEDDSDDADTERKALIEKGRKNFFAYLRKHLTPGEVYENPSDEELLEWAKESIDDEGEDDSTRGLNNTPGTGRSTDSSSDNSSAQSDVNDNTQESNDENTTVSKGSKIKKAVLAITGITAFGALVYTFIKDLPLFKSQANVQELNVVESASEESEA